MNDKPVFIMRLKNEMRKLKNDVGKLPKNMSTELEHLVQFV